MTTTAQCQVPGHAGRTHVCLFVVGLLCVIGACGISRYVAPDWTGAIVGGLATVGVFLAFLAGLLSRD